MSGKTIEVFAILIFAAILAPGQWLEYPTPGVPRLPNGRPNLAAAAPRTAYGKPDFSGLWEPSAQGQASPTVAGEVPLPAEVVNIAARLKDGLPYRPWSRELQRARQDGNGKNSPTVRCLPMGMVWMLSQPFPRKVIQSRNLVVILYEKDTQYRQIFTDGRPLPDDPQPSFNGYSSGSWEGDTLVVQTIGLRDDLWADLRGNPITAAAKVTEKMRRPNYGNLEIEVTVDDTKAYTAPWTVTLHHHIKLDTDLLEYVCLENEKDASRLVGQ